MKVNFCIRYVWMCRLHTDVVLCVVVVSYISLWYNNFIVLSNFVDSQHTTKNTFSFFGQLIKCPHFFDHALLHDDDLIDPIQTVQLVRYRYNSFVFLLQKVLNFFCPVYPVFRTLLCCCTCHVYPVFRTLASK